MTSLAQTGDVGQTLQSGVFAGLSSAAFYAVGSQFTDKGALVSLEGTDKFLAQTALHGLTGGVLSVIQGGKFGHGFLSSSLSKAASLGVGEDGLDLNIPGRFATAVIVGGTVSEISGGKFANGAVTAAFAFVSNELATEDTASLRDASEEAWKRIDKFMEENPGEIVPISSSDFEAIVDYDAKILDSLGIDESHEMIVERLRDADGDFFNLPYREATFSVESMPTASGSDVNYYYIGMAFSRYGFTSADLSKAVLGWNLKQAAEAG